MRTQIMNDPNAGAPWFEYYQVGGSRPIKQEICQFPFVIGRDAAADFRVDSSRVSRKHVLIDRGPNGGYVLRDLESTNGTYVNGKQISETELNHGDVIVVADFELTFFSGNLSDRVSATQVMTQPVSGRRTDAVDLIIQVRRLHETLTHRSISSRFQPVMRLDTGHVHGYEAIHELEDLPGHSRQAGSIVYGTECRLTERIHQQHRLYAAEQAKLLEEETHLFFALKTSEVSADFLPESFDRLADVVGNQHQLVAEVPETAVCDIPYFRRFVAALRERRVKIAYGGFCGGANQIAEWLDFAPDYLKLAPAIAKGVSRAGGGWRMVQSLVAVTRDLGCEVIAGGIDERSDAESLRELGCQYAQGDFFGQPEPLVKYLGRTPALAAAGY